MERASASIHYAAVVCSSQRDADIRRCENVLLIDQEEGHGVT